MKTLGYTIILALSLALIIGLSGCSGSNAQTPHTTKLTTPPAVPAL